MKEDDVKHEEHETEVKRNYVIEKLKTQWNTNNIKEISNMEYESK